METSHSNNLATLHQAVESTDTLRDPPVNLEAEQALLGAILANNTAYERVAEFLLPEHFADPVHARIYEACGKLLDQSRLANAITLKNLFAQSDELAEIGGAQYLAQLQSSYVSIINARDYARTIHDLFLRRQLIGLGDDMVNDAFDYDPDVTAMAQIEKAEVSLYNLAESGQTEGGLKSFRVAITEAVNMAEVAFRRDGHIAGTPTGFTDVDKLLGGLHKSDLLIVAGRPSMGKTSFATNIAFNAASSRRVSKDAEGNVVETPEVVAFFSLEMSAEQLATRIISEQVHVRSDSIRRGEIREEEFDRLFEASRTLQTLPLFIDDTPALSIPALRTRARRLKRQHGLSLIIVDYLQLMHSVGRSRNDGRVQEVSEITRGLKAIAKELDVPLIALSQLSRAPEQRDDKRPQLSDLRESGSIEQDADVVIFLYREEYYLAREKPSQRGNETTEKFNERLARYDELLERARNKAEIIIAKQRHGPIGTVELQFTGEYTQFNDLAPEDRLPDATW
jgi:replicative DNA helicase